MISTELYKNARNNKVRYLMPKKNFKYIYDNIKFPIPSTNHDAKQSLIHCTGQHQKLKHNTSILIVSHLLQVS